MHRFDFRFFNATQYRSADIVIVGTHYDDARTAAWTILGEQERDRAPRETWRLVSSVHRPAGLQEPEVTS